MGYSKKVMDHFRNPHNYGKINNADGIGEVGNLACGDVMKLYLKVVENENNVPIIEDIKFETFGCVAAISTSSMVTDLAKGKSLQDALNISKKDIIDELDGLPPIKFHCSILATEAMVEAVHDYLTKNGKEISPELESKHQKLEKERGVACNSHEVLGEYPEEGESVKVNTEPSSGKCETCDDKCYTDENKE